MYFAANVFAALILGLDVVILNLIPKTLLHPRKNNMKLTRLKLWKMICLFIPV